MVIEFKSNIFIDNDEDFSDLRYLINLCTRKKRYSIHVEYPEIKESHSFNKFDADQQTIIQELYEKSILESWNFQYTICKHNPAYFSLTEAIRFLDQPFLIFLENNLNDGYFIDALIKSFENEGAILNKHKAEGWVKYGMGGGSTIQQAIEAEIRNYSNLPKANHKYLRCFVILDSDKNYPTQAQKPKLQRLVSFLEQNNIYFHVFEKRELENYLPTEVFLTIDGDVEFISTVDNLSSVQKDYISIQIGMPNKELDESINWEREVKLLFSNLDNNQVEILKTKNLNMTDFKTEYPKLFLDERVTKETLLARCSHQNNPNELPDLLNRITELL